MSKVTELAEAEAEQTEDEPDEPDAPETDEPETDEPDEPSAPVEDFPAEPTEAMLRSLDKEQARHEKRVHEIMGPFVAGMVACAECSGVGLAAPVELRAHEKYKRCGTCDGLSVVATGARIEQYASAPCPGCGGRGYLEKLDTPLPTTTATVTQPNGETQYGTPAWMGDPALASPGYGPPPPA